jgi:regulatory protein
VTEADAREKALGEAYRHLGRRDRTVAEVRRNLERRGIEDTAIEDAVGALLEQGYLDDERYARRFAEDRRTLDGWGAERIARRLAEVGVAPEIVEAVLARDPGAELDDAVAVLRRRLSAPPSDDRSRDRALGILVRRGYELEVAYDAVRAFARDAA